MMQQQIQKKWFVNLKHDKKALLRAFLFLKALIKINFAFISIFIYYINILE